MPAPHNYDDAGIVIQVNPTVMFLESTVTMSAYGQVIADHIGAIVDIWNGLKLGWSGDTAEAAKGFFDEWSNAIRDLFGTEDDPDRGVLNKIANAVATAALNYGGTEDAVTTMFDNISSAIEVAAIIRPVTPLSNYSDPNRPLSQGPISEKTPGRW